MTFADAPYYQQECQIDTPFVLDDINNPKPKIVHGLLLAMGLPRDYVKSFPMYQTKDEFIDRLF